MGRPIWKKRGERIGIERTDLQSNSRILNPHARAQRGRASQCVVPASLADVRHLVGLQLDPLAHELFDPNRYVEIVGEQHGESARRSRPGGQEAGIAQQRRRLSHLRRNRFQPDAHQRKQVARGRPILARWRRGPVRAACECDRAAKSGDGERCREMLPPPHHAG